MASQSNKNIDMINGPLFKSILLFAIPLGLASIFQLLFNAADVIVVSRYAGQTSMAAVSSTGSLTSLIINLFIGFSVGTNVVAARYLGAGKNDKVSEVASTSIIIGLVAGIALAIFGFFASRSLLIMMKSPDDVIDLSTLYVKIYFLGTPGNLLYNFGAALLRSKGDTKRPLYILTVAGVLNFVLNLVFVILFKMDVAGVALATIASQYASAYLAIRALAADYNHPTRIDIKNMKFTKDAFIDILKVGLPAGVQSSMFSISNVIIQSSVNSFGSIVMAGSGAAASIGGFVFSSTNAFYQTNMTFTSANIGAKNYNKINKILYASLICVTIVGFITGWGAYIFGEQLLSIYLTEPETIASGMIRVIYVVRWYFIYGWLDVFTGAMRGMGYSIMPMFISLAGICGIRILWIQTYFALHHTIEAVYLSYPVSWIVTTLVYIIAFIIGRIQLEKKIKNELD